MSEFSSDDVARQAMSNAQALALVTTAYLVSNGMNVDDYWSFVGDRFAPGWERLQDEGAMEAMRMFALDMVSFGASLDSLSGDHQRAEAVISGWPSGHMLEAFGVGRNDSDRSFVVFDAVADFLGLDYGWRRQGERVTLTLAR